MERDSNFSATPSKTSKKSDSHIIKSRHLQRKSLAKYKQEERGENAPAEKKKFNGRGSEFSAMTSNQSKQERPSVARSSNR